MCLWMFVACLCPNDKHMTHIDKQYSNYNIHSHLPRFSHVGRLRVFSHSKLESIMKVSKQLAVGFCKECFHLGNSAPKLQTLETDQVSKGEIGKDEVPKQVSIIST